MYEDRAIKEQQAFVMHLAIRESIRVIEYYAQAELSLTGKVDPEALMVLETLKRLMSHLGEPADPSKVVESANYDA